ncbi:MAG TPA: zinc-binding dehydrogenase, partial [Bacillota bacterium]
GAAIGIPYLTAYRALHIVGRARPGDWVLVHGASGGVGTAAMQLGAAAGMHMVGTAGSAEGIAYVESLGAGPAYRHDDLEQAAALTGGRGFDVILEMAAHVSLGKVLPHLARGGRAVVIGSRGAVEITPRDLMSREASVVGMMRGGGGEDELRRINEALAPALRAGLLAPRIGLTMPLARAADAHRAILERGFYGKLVLVI